MQKFDMHTPKEEVEHTLANIAEKDKEARFKKGLPVRTADGEGIYELYSDGTKVYVKRFDEDV